MPVINENHFAKKETPKNKNKKIKIKELTK